MVSETDATQNQITTSIGNGLKRLVVSCLTGLLRKSHNQTIFQGKSSVYFESKTMSLQEEVKEMTILDVLTSKTLLWRTFIAALAW